VSASNDVYTATAADSGITALVADRITIGQVVESTYPQIVLVVPISSDNTMYRDQDGAAGRTTLVVQFDCYAETAEEAEQVADAVISRWDGLQLSSPDIGRAFVNNKIGDGYDGSLNVYRYIVEVEVETSV
jgi:hypothetical protein